MPGHGVDRVVDQIGPDLVELARVRADLRHVRPEVSDDADVAELVTQHQQRARETVGDVDLLERPTVELGVRTHRGDQLRDATRRLLDLAEQRCDGEGASDPFQSRLQGSTVQRGVRPLAPGRVDTGRDEGRSYLPGLRDAVLGDPRGKRLLVVGSIERVEVGRSRSQVATQRVQRGEVWAVMSSPASRLSEASRASLASSSASTARVAAAAGLLSSWARPAARVPRVTRDSRCRTVDSMDRAVL